MNLDDGLAGCWCGLGDLVDKEGCCGAFAALDAWGGLAWMQDMAV
jgi:hypothetical protein